MSLNPKSNPVIAIIGATATGKTQLALELFDRYPVRLISVDSAQVYRHMNIGSAKLSPAELARYPHALIDILEPEQPYSAAQFCQDAQAAMQSAWAEGKVPVLVGGTMLYFHALFTGLADLPSADEAVRERLHQRFASEGGKALWQQLHAHDPHTAAQISENDQQRLVRFLELIEITGETPSALFAKQQSHQPQWQTLALSLQLERPILHERIATRFHHMMAAGFEAEVAALMQRPQLSPDAPSMKSAGYRQLWAYLSGQCSREAAIEQGIINTRQLAKRQITWQNNRLQSALPLTPIHAQDVNGALQQVAQFLESAW